MKPPWQSQHCPTSSSNSPHYTSSRIETSQPQISSSPVTDPSHVLSQLFAQQQQNAMHPSYLAMFSKPSDQRLAFDPRMQIPVIPHPRSQMLGMQHPSLSSGNPYQQRRSAPQRVSLRRDIDIAGERDKDSPASAGIGASYPYTGDPLLHSQIPSSSRLTPDRPITMLGNMQHSYQQHSMMPKQQEHPSYTSPTFNTQQHPGFSGLSVQKDIKQEVIKQEPMDKGMFHPPSETPQDHPTTQHPSTTQRHGPSLQPKLDSAPPPGGSYEQKSKEDLVLAMDKVDREIAKVESEINRIQKKKTQLEERAKMPPEPEKSASSPQRVEPKHRDLWQVIYAENRKKAEAARSILDGLCPRYDMPLYNQPCDTDVYQVNLKKNEEMRPKLVKYFKHRSKLQNIRQRYICTRYEHLMAQWNRRAERIENNVKKKAKDAKTREFFEKLFPEIRKQREQQERVDRVGTRGDSCRSDADFAEIVDGLSEQENQLNHMRQLAVVDPMLLDSEEQRIRFISTNGFIREPFKDFKESQQLDSWTEQEKKIFKEKFIQHPKNFHLIASFIEKKSVADCILYYYLTKKTNNYKALVRKQSMKAKKPKSGRSHASTQDQVSGNKDGSDKTEDGKKEGEEGTEMKIDRPPSPRMTRARKQTMNWTEEEISLVKEGFGKHGKDFGSISRMVSNKSEQQVKNFYHNYKKKHGLDQLITDSRKKKTNESRRTRHHVASPDTSSTTQSTTTSTTQSTTATDATQSTEVKTKLEKVEETSSTDEKKKPNERTPSPAAAKQATKPDPPDVTTVSTSQIRTRRITAALAAAATPDDGQPTKRTVDDSSVPPSGEPAEKKQKKNERKPKSGKQSNEKEVKVEAEQSKPMDEHKKVDDSVSDGKLTESPKKEVDPASGSKAAPPKSSESKWEEEGRREEEGDSSATCSAEEDNSDPTNATSTTNPTKHSSPYAFDDDVNDSPTRIRLEAARVTTTIPPQTPANPPHATTPLQTTTNPPHTPNPPYTSTNPLMTTIIPQHSDSGALNLARKPASAPTAPIVPDVDPRPQSLPPSSMIPSYLPHPASTESMKKTMIIPELNYSRPSSTPVFPGFTHDPAPQTAPEKKVEKSPVVVKPSPPYLPTTQHVESIHNLKYVGKPVTGHMKSEVHPAMRHPTPSVSDEKRKAPHVGDFRYMGQHYHQVPSAAASLQKDFNPQVIPPSSIHIPILHPGYQRHYTEKDMQSMKERSADIPDPIPVSSLRFTSTKPSQPYIPVSNPSAAVIQLLATKHSDVKPHQDPLKHPTLTTPHQATPHVTPTSVSPSRVSAPRPHDRGAFNFPTYKPSSPDRVQTSHLSTLPGSITQGKPVFRAPTSQPHAEEERPRNPPKPPQIIPTNLARRASSEMSPPVRRTSVSTSSPRDFLSTPLGIPTFPGIPYHYPLIQSKPLTTSRVVPGDKTLSFPHGALRPEHLAMFEGVSQNYHPVVGSIMHGTPIKRKTSDEPSVSPRNVITPPQPKPSERKVSQIHRKSETPPHLPTPLKEEMRRPSSVSRATPDRKTYSVSVSPGMASHHRSHSTQSLHLPPKPSFPLATHPSTEHLQHTVATDPRFMSQYLNFQSQGLPAAKDINTLMQEFSRTNQIPATFGIPALLRSFPPGMPDNLENSRHNLLTQDYHTAQLMQQQLEAARRSPFSVMSVPSSIPLATRPVLVSAPNFNSLVPPRHPGSPNPLQFLPQHPMLPLVTQSSPGMSRASSTNSPTSPHRNPQMKLRYQVPSPLPQYFEHRSKSPKTMGDRSRTPTLDTRQPHEPRIASPAHYPTHKEIPTRGYEPPEQGGNSLTPRGSGSPHHHHHPLSKPIKTELISEAEPQSQGHPSNPQRATHTSHQQKKPPTTDTQLRGYDLTQRRSLETREVRKEVEKPVEYRMIPEQYALAVQDQEKTAKELKIKGRAKMTPAYLIDAIINHNIMQFGESAEKMDKAKESTSSSQSQMNLKSEPESVHRMFYEPPQPAAHQQATPQKTWQKAVDKQESREVARPRDDRHSPSVMHTKTLHEHSKDVISDLYRKSESQQNVDRPSTINQAPKPEFLGQTAGFLPNPIIQGESNKAKTKAVTSTTFGINRMGPQLQHPFVAPMFAGNPQLQNTIPLEHFIRDALLSDPQQQSKLSQPSAPVPAAIPQRVVNSPLGQIPAQNISKPAGYNANVASEMISSPMFMSALSVRAGQGSSVPQVPPANVSGRPSPITGAPGNASSARISSSGTYHPASSVERAPPLLATQYEPISDSD